MTRGKNNDDIQVGEGAVMLIWDEWHFGGDWETRASSGHAGRLMSVMNEIGTGGVLGGGNAVKKIKCKKILTIIKNAPIRLPVARRKKKSGADL